jgi:hypothetical protein
MEFSRPVAARLLWNMRKAGRVQRRRATYPARYMYLDQDRYAVLTFQIKPIDIQIG